ncbi:Mannose-6-phosphate isomerase [Enhygromyxa salina]|uniref:Mannose-6-phosphate isomerase n=1 Tax=Enhygromyxa salina TaxID=215803 RepID=A0A0C2D2R3_9BACT|nr:hypothetical protein [Enhygromyxa salina]KIG17551.1 Mannose-6-phosphate isomerase [Enhygromyxa salina]
MPKDRIDELESDESTAPINEDMTVPYDTGELRRLARGEVKQVLERLAGEPLRLRRDNLVPRPWGGRSLLTFKGLEGATRPGRYGESFEVSAYPDDPEAARYPSIVEFADGSSMGLGELLGRAGETVLGRSFFAAYGPNIPLLPKLLDVEGLLSVQSHPPGNPEAYVVINCDPGATLRVGFNHNVNSEQMRQMLRAARATQEQLGALFWVSEDRYAPILAELLGKPNAVARLGERLTPLLHKPGDRPRLLESLEVLDSCYRAMLDSLNVIELAPGMVIFNADPPGASTEVTPSAQVHCLGNPEGRAVLMLEVRRPGTTHRAWDHVRFPARELAIDEAFATMTSQATRAEQFVCERTPVVGRPGVFRTVSCGAFVIDHLCPRPGLSVDALTDGMPSTLHGIRGSVRLQGPDDVNWGVLRAGESMLLPAGIQRLRLDAQTSDSEVVQVTIPLPPAYYPMPIEDQPTRELRTFSVDEAKLDNLAQTRQLVAESAGPSQVMAIVNAGDSSELRARLRALTPAIFRADGATKIYVHEEATRRGQLLGLLDALRSQRERDGGLDPDRVTLGVMLPGKGTRLSPLTQRLHGIKPLFPVPVRVNGPLGPVWLDGGTASVWTWTLVAWALEHHGFRGVAWKWGDEPQVAARLAAAFDYDLADVDAVRFGAAIQLDGGVDGLVANARQEALASSKEWLLADAGSRDLIVQLRRRPLAQLRDQLAKHQGERRVNSFVHVGSPAFSHLFLQHAERVFGDLEGWLDVDGYLFEALTHDEAAWAAELERDPQLRALIERCPDFYARVAELRRGIQAERGHPLRIVVVDIGAESYWGDIGQLSRARDVWSALAVDGEQGEFARELAGFVGVVPDRHGNYLVGDSRVPDDGSVRGCVVIDSVIGRGRAQGAVLLGSRLGIAGLEPGSVAIECHVNALRLGRDSLAFGSIGDYLRLPAAHVHTSIVADPGAVKLQLESWFADMREDPGAGDNYTTPRYGNPTSFAAKFQQMRQREVETAELEARIQSLASTYGPAREQ